MARLVALGLGPAFKDLDREAAARQIDGRCGTSWARTHDNCALPASGAVRGEAGELSSTSAVLTRWTLTITSECLCQSAFHMMDSHE